MPQCNHIIGYADYGTQFTDEGSLIFSSDNATDDVTTPFTYCPICGAYLPKSAFYGTFTCGLMVVTGLVVLFILTAVFAMIATDWWGL